MKKIYTILILFILISTSLFALITPANVRAEYRNAINRNTKDNSRQIEVILNDLWYFNVDVAVSIVPLKAIISGEYENVHIFKGYLDKVEAEARCIEKFTCESMHVLVTYKGWVLFDSKISSGSVVALKFQGTVVRDSEGGNILYFNGHVKNLIIDLPDIYL
jgi:hypothetical protein